jgi:hypothetical protein
VVVFVDLILLTDQRGFCQSELFLHPESSHLLEATMRDAEYCRAQARFCKEMASIFKRPDYQEWWLGVAQKWRDLAEQADRERNEHRSNKAA